jgi:E3 ubiquitin-protein ligase MARCH6
MQWMRYSRKEFCELCGHKFSFTPIYSPDMPRVLPLKDVCCGLLSSIGKAVKSWIHYTLVALAWLGAVPLTAYRTYKFLFSGSLEHLLTFPLDLFSTENIEADIFRGCFVVLCTLFAFIGLIWLREQILHGGGPEWLEREDAVAPAAPAEEQDDNNNAEGEEVDENNGNGNNNDENHNNNNNNNILDNNILIANPREAAAPVADDLLDDEDIPLLQPAPVVNNPIAPPPPPIQQQPVPVAPIDVPMDNAEPPIADPDPIDPVDAQEQEGGADEANWNPMEWDRAAEELTWERLLGLDGSMVFLEHVFWVVSLNTLFIFIFAFCPYSIGNFAISFLGIIR